MERWIMNRLGFVNFWVYDEEVFPLKNGKILLRGSNGSGKSITTQSFIPYILDGDRQPSRLDPFGSKDRKMSFYLLDDRGEEKDESTGYLFLEFKKPESGQYRTIGIGLHARKGGNMNTWGFCILDGRRVGYDFSLYKTVGGKNIPFDARRLKEELGEKNLFAEKMSVYKEIVAKYIFGIEPENISDYDNLTDILIKTRSSKLASKENLKPAQLYEVLNESMQTLSDDDLRPMADAMNRIEELNGHIEDAERALDETKYISAEYRKYNAYVLWNKSRRYMKKHALAAELRKNAEKFKSDIEENKILLETADREYDISMQTLSDYKREKESLDLTDIEARITQKQSALSSIERDRKDESVKKRICDEKKEQIRKKYIEKRDTEIKIEDYGYETEVQLKEYRTYEEYQFPFYDNYLAGINNDPDFCLQGSVCRRECASFADSVKKALNAINKYESEKLREDEALRKLDAAKEEAEKSRRELAAAETAFDEQKDRLIESYYIASKNNEEYEINEDTLSELEELVSKYEGSGSAAELYRVLGREKNIIEKKLIGIETEQKLVCQKYRDECSEKSAELEKLKNMTEPVPERNERREEARKKLSENGVKFYSYYECIDFTDNVDEETRAVLEAELIDSGMLDALVIPGADRKLAEEILGDVSDCIILDDENRFTESRYFKNIFDFSVPYPETDENGFFRNGIISGHANSYGSVRFIGTESRKRYREKMISDLTQLLAESQLLLENAISELEKIRIRIKTLDSEYKKMLDTSDIDAACSFADKCRSAVDVKIKNLEHCEKEYSLVRSAIQTYKVEAERLCSGFPYKRTSEEYSDVYDSVMSYRDTVMGIIDILRNKSEKMRELSALEDMIADAEENVESIENDLKSISARIHASEETVRLCDEFLNSSENADKKERAEFLVKVIDESEQKCREYSSSKTRCEVMLNNLSEQLEKERENLKTAEDEENMLREIYIEELNLGYNSYESSKTPEQFASELEKNIAETEKQKSFTEIQDRLADSYRKHSSVLSAEYGMNLGHCFEDDDTDTVRRRMQITLIWKGKKISPFDFEKELIETIENDRLLIRKNEEEMFKEILLDTISKKLYTRIEESRKWVDSMAELMQGINTSMGLSFSLSWKPKKDINENEMNYDELSRILIKSRELVSNEDFERLSEHFSSKIEQEKMLLEEKGSDINYSDIIRTVLDFRNWFEFKLHFRQPGSPKYSELTNSRFNTFSGGERALSLYIPLFAAVAAQYKKAGDQAPMILALDEAFAGVDDSNISEMFGLLEKLGFGYIMNSQALWGCYETVPSLEIAELFHEKDSGVITVILYEWNGKRKILEE